MYRLKHGLSDNTFFNILIESAEYIVEPGANLSSKYDNMSKDSP